MNRVSWLVLFCVANLCLIAGMHESASGASELIANFDSFPEGAIDTEFIDGGIRFHSLDTDLGSPEYEFIVESMTNEIWLPLSTPNYLVFTGWVGGPGGGLSRFLSMEMSFDQFAVSAGIDLFTPIFEPHALLTLTAYRDDTEIASATAYTRDAIEMTNFARHNHLSLTGAPFNRLKLVSYETLGGPPTFTMLGVDNVRVSVIPEPAAFSLVIGATLGLLGFGGRVK